MKLPDSCVWIEALVDSTTGRRYLDLLDDAEQLLVPTLVMYEVQRWALRERNPEAAEGMLAVFRQSRIVPLDDMTAVRGAALASAHKLAAVDALIYACALQHKAELVSCDVHFKGLPGVDYQAKDAH